ncbi:hypothetical protein K710_0299 [Streptococcus iniae SF1]|nr:hypothetical protein K710_0299 [Streptococcus iniae SF1]
MPFDSELQKKRAESLKNLFFIPLPLIILAMKMLL